jgi:hypothetical protein
MADDAAALLTREDLRALPDPVATPADCACAHLRCAGWESPRRTWKT